MLNIMVIYFNVNAISLQCCICNYIHIYMYNCVMRPFLEAIYHGELREFAPENRSPS